MGKISENEIWMPEPESKVSQTFSLSPGQARTRQSGCGPCFGNSCGTCPRARFWLPDMLMVFIFLTCPRNTVTPVWGVNGQDLRVWGTTKCRKSAWFCPVQGHNFKPNITSFQSQVTPPSLSCGCLGWQQICISQPWPSFLPSLVLGKNLWSPQTSGGCLSPPRSRGTTTLWWYHLLSPPGCPSPTIHHQLLGEEPAVRAGTTVPA